MVSILTEFSSFSLLAQTTQESSGNTILGMELSSLLLFGGVLILVTLTVFNMRRRRGGTDNRVSAQDKLAQMDQVNGMKKDMSAMMVELEELTRQFGAQLDGKSTRLEKLIDEADQKIETMRALLQQDMQQSSTPTSNSTLRQTPVQPQAYAQQPGTMTSSYAESETGLRHEGHLVDQQPGHDPKKERIFELSRQGKSPLQIARELDEQVGKVELILALGE